MAPILDHVGCRHRAKLGPISEPKWTSTWKGLNLPSIINPNSFSILLGFGASGLIANMDQTLVKNGVEIEVGFCIDFWSILARFGEGFGKPKPTQNRSKTDPKTCSKMEPSKSRYKPVSKAATPIGQHQRFNYTCPGCPRAALARAS